MLITLAVQTEAPKIQPPQATEIAAYFGKSVTLDCFASGKPTAKISWILPDGMRLCEVGTVHTELSSMSLLQNGTLQICSPNFSSKGDYKCIASNAAGADTITYHLHVAALPPSISEEAMDTVIIQQGAVSKFTNPRKTLTKHPSIFHKQGLFEKDDNMFVTMSFLNS